MRENDIHWVEFRKPKGKPYHGRLKVGEQVYPLSGPVCCILPVRAVGRDIDSLGRRCVQAIVETMREEGVVFASSPPKSLMANGESGVGQ
eukprot:scaffold655_cov379-Prasinococcus_capsulatus_cf.AAC.30